MPLPGTPRRRPVAANDGCVITLPGCGCLAFIILAAIVAGYLLSQ